MARDQKQDEDAAAEDREPVPRIGRGRLVPRFPMTEIVRILMLLLALVVIFSMRNACGSGIANWFNIVAPTQAGGTGAAAGDAGPVGKGR